MADVTVQEIRTRVKDSGYGKPIIFIHGHPDTADVWDALIEYLPKDGYRYIRPDLPGYGESGDGKTFDLSMENRGKWVADVLAAMGVHEPVIVVGHDHGGPFAASFAIQYEQQVSRLILMNTIFHPDYKWHLFGALWRTPLVGEYLAFWQSFSIVRPIMAWAMKRSELQINDTYIAALQRNFTPKMGQQMLRLYRATDPERFAGWEERLHALMKRKPTLVLWGEHDKYIPVEFAERLHSEGAQLAKFGDAGHWLMVTKPEEVARKITRFLEEG